MGLPRFIKLPSYKRFAYSPRYWDPEKEAREERIRRIKQEMGIDIPSAGPGRTTIKRGSFRQAQRKLKIKASSSSNIRLVVILVVLLFLAYLILFR
jgi:hypothetical protein